MSESIEDLYQRFGPMVHRRARKLLGDDQAAWDALQEVFVRAMRSHGSFRGDSSPMTWLYRITTNYCFTVLRDSGRRQQKLCQQMPAPSADGAPDAELRLALTELLGQLPADVCEIAVYYHVDRMTHDEIAAVAGVSPRTVANRLQAFRDQANALWAPALEAAR